MFESFLQYSKAAKEVVDGFIDEIPDLIDEIREKGFIQGVSDRLIEAGKIEQSHSFNAYQLFVTNVKTLKQKVGGLEIAPHDLADNLKELQAFIDEFNISPRIYEVFIKSLLAGVKTSPKHSKKYLSTIFEAHQYFDEQILSDRALMLNFCRQEFESLYSQSFDQEGEEEKGEIENKNLIAIKSLFTHLDYYLPHLSIVDAVQQLQKLWVFIDKNYQEKDIKITKEQYAKLHLEFEGRITKLKKSWEENTIIFINKADSLSKEMTQEKLFPQELKERLEELEKLAHHHSVPARVYEEGLDKLLSPLPEMRKLLDQSKINFLTTIKNNPAKMKEYLSHEFFLLTTFNLDKNPENLLKRLQYYRDSIDPSDYRKALQELRPIVEEQEVQSDSDEEIFYDAIEYSEWDEEEASIDQQISESQSTWSFSSVALSIAKAPFQVANQYLRWSHSNPKHAFLQTTLLMSSAFQMTSAMGQGSFQQKRSTSSSLITGPITIAQNTTACLSVVGNEGGAWTVAYTRVPDLYSYPTTYAKIFSFQGSLIGNETIMPGLDTTPKMTTLQSNHDQIVQMWSTNGAPNSISISNLTGPASCTTSFPAPANVCIMSSFTFTTTPQDNIARISIWSDAACQTNYSLFVQYVDSSCKLIPSNPNSINKLTITGLSDATFFSNGEGVVSWYYNNGTDTATTRVITELYLLRINSTAYPMGEPYVIHLNNPSGVDINRPPKVFLTTYSGNINLVVASISYDSGIGGPGSIFRYYIDITTNNLINLVTIRNTVGGVLQGRHTPAPAISYSSGREVIVWCDLGGIGLAYGNCYGQLFVNENGIPIGSKFIVGGPEVTNFAISSVMTIAKKESFAFIWTTLPNLCGIFSTVLGDTKGSIFPLTPIINIPTSTLSYAEGKSYTINGISVDAIYNPNPVTVTLNIDSTTGSLITAATSGTATSRYDNITGTFTVTGDIAGVNNLLSTIQFTPKPYFYGNVSLQVQASDGYIQVGPEIMVLTGSHVNHVPSFASLPLQAQACTVDVPCNFNYSSSIATDSDIGDVLSFTASGLPGMQFQYENSLLKFTTLSSQAGIIYGNLTVFDQEGLSVNTTFPVTFSLANNTVYVNNTTPGSSTNSAIPLSTLIGGSVGALLFLGLVGYAATGSILSCRDSARLESTKKDSNNYGEEVAALIETARLQRSKENFSAVAAVVLAVKQNIGLDKGDERTIGNPKEFGIKLGEAIKQHPTLIERPALATVGFWSRNGILDKDATIKMVSTLAATVLGKVSKDSPQKDSHSSRSTSTTPDHREDREDIQDRQDRQDIPQFGGFGGAFFGVAKVDDQELQTTSTAPRSLPTPPRSQFSLYTQQ
jgi:hypothetical protein